MTPATAGMRASALRRIPLPMTEPPYDDDLSPVARRPERDTRPTQGSLALAYVLPSGVAAVPEPAAPLRLVDLPEHTDALDLPARRAVQVDDLPDPCRWTARLAQGIVEALHGHRPLQQLVRWTDEEVYAMLERRLAARRPTDGPRPLVRSVRVCQPADDVVEASVVVENGGRCRALALRLEALDARWRCTELEII
ncbi:MAG: Rv3235 family protein [Jiangellaceae bacterium]